MIVLLRRLAEMARCRLKTVIVAFSQVPPYGGWGPTTRPLPPEWFKYPPIS
jgi:hypothetical protein